MSSLRWFTGLFRRFRSLVLRDTVRLEGRCAMCGRCCRDILLMYEGVWLSKAEQYRAMLEQLPHYSRFEPLGRDGEGHMTFTCNRLGEGNRCTDYENRPSLCRKYPSKSLYYQGGWLRNGCGFSFEAKTFRDAFLRRIGLRPDFAEVLGKELHKHDAGPEKEEDTL